MDRQIDDMVLERFKSRQTTRTIKPSRRTLYISAAIAGGNVAVTAYALFCMPFGALTMVLIWITIMASAYSGYMYAEDVARVKYGKEQKQ
jgi:cytochrome b